MTDAATLEKRADTMDRLPPPDDVLPSLGGTEFFPAVGPNEAVGLA